MARLSRCVQMAARDSVPATGDIDWKPASLVSRSVTENVLHVLAICCMLHAALMHNIIDAVHALKKNLAIVFGKNYWNN